MKVLICGDRHWNDFKTIREFIKKLMLENVELIIIEGGCRGADAISAYVARDWGIGVIEEKADWFKQGKVAGPIRNQRMLDCYKPDLVVAFHNDIENSKGTKDMLKRAKEQSFETRLITSQGIVDTEPITKH